MGAKIKTLQYKQVLSGNTVFSQFIVQNDYIPTAPFTSFSGSYQLSPQTKLFTISLATSSTSSDCVKFVSWIKQN